VAPQSEPRRGAREARVGQVEGDLRGGATLAGRVTSSFAGDLPSTPISGGRRLPKTANASCGSSALACFALSELNVELEGVE